MSVLHCEPNRERKDLLKACVLIFTLLRSLNHNPWLIDPKLMTLPPTFFRAQCIILAFFNETLRDGGYTAPNIVQVHAKSANTGVQKIYVSLRTPFFTFESQLIN